MIKCHQKYFIESIPYDEVNPEKVRQNNQRFKNINNIENKKHVFKSTQKQNSLANITLHFIKHNTQKLLSNTKKVLT